MDQSTQTSNQYDDPVISQQAKNLTKAIFQHESGMDYNAKGDAGTSTGAGQWQPDTWRTQAKDVLGDENAPMTPENQSVVAQGTIRKLIKQGKNAAQIAAIWNSGSDKNWENKIGTTVIGGQQIKYNVPQYVKGVTDLYQKYKSESQGISGLATSQGLVQKVGEVGQDIAQRYTQAGTAVSQAVTGKISPISGVLQTVGAGAGAIGDITTKALELVPGVKQIEGAVGSVLGGLTNTSWGKSIVGAAGDFAKAHPELAGDIGAVANIASVIPMFKAIGLTAGAARSAVGSMFKNKLAEATASEMESALTPAMRRTITQAGKQTGSSVAKDAIDNNILPDVVQNQAGKKIYSTATADNLANEAERIQEQNLQYLLKSKSDLPISLKQARDSAITQVRKDLRFNPDLPRVEAQIHDTFDYWEKRFGQKFTLSQMTDMKRDVREQVNFARRSGTALPPAQQQASFYTGQGLMKSVENTAMSRGIQGVRDVNNTMARIINVRKMLASLEGKQIPTKKTPGSWYKEVATDIAGGIGESALSAVPFSGTLAGRGIMGRLISRTPKSKLEKLIQTQKPRPSLSRIAGLGAGAAILRTAGQPQSAQ